MSQEMLNRNDIQYLDWDSQFFGFSIGRIYAHTCTKMILEKALENAAKEKIQFVELFCDVSDVQSIDASEKLAFHLADVRLTFKKNLTGHLKDNDNIAKDLTLKKAGPGDIAALKATGQGLFTNSRYYQYPGFDRNKVDLLFQIWIEKAIKGEFDDELYYLGNETDILAFNSLKYNEKENVASIGLFGVNEAHRGKGLASLLLNQVFHLLQKRQVTELNVVTQGKNSHAVHLYQKNGFFLSKIILCYYHWLESKEK